MDSINLLHQKIAEANNISLLSHVNPDGDTLGAMLALYFIIDLNFNKKPAMVAMSKIPDIYKFLPGVKEIKNLSEIDKNFKYDLAVALDIAAKDRMVDAFSIFQNAKVNINIDHHHTNNNYGAINFVNPKACSTGEVLYNIAKELGWKLNQDIATCIYTSISTDTGNFRYENTTSNTLIHAAELIKLGADPCQISRKCYESKPKPMIMLMAHCVSNAVFLEDDKIAYAVLRDSDMKKFNADSDHTEGISEVLRQISTTEVAILFKEINENQTKVSLRSKNADISAVAEKFGGGGHKYAAGCTIKKPANIAVEKLIEEIKKIL